MIKVKNPVIGYFHPISGLVLRLLHSRWMLLVVEEGFVICGKPSGKKSDDQNERGNVQKV